MRATKLTRLITCLIAAVTSGLYGAAVSLDELLPVGRCYVYDNLDPLTPALSLVGRYNVVGDTVIDGNQAKIIHFTNQYWADPSGPVSYAFIKDNKIYATGASSIWNNCEPYKICDFDIIENSPVDTIYIAGKPVKRYFTEEMGYWIDGLGYEDPSYLLTLPVMTIGWVKRPFSALYQDGELVYSAEDFVPDQHANEIKMFLPGRSWKLTKVRKDRPDEVVDEITAYVDGDTIIEPGHKCVKLAVEYKSKPGEINYFAAYERYNAVYVSLPNKYHKYSWLTCLMAFNYEDSHFGIKSERDYISINGNLHPRYKIFSHYGAPDQIEKGIWIMGIGASSSDSYLTFSTHEFSYSHDEELKSTTLLLQGCYDRGNCIFSRSDFNSTAGVSESNPDESSYPACDIYGRKVTDPQPGQILIKQGKKIIVR